MGLAAQPGEEPKHGLHSSSPLRRLFFGRPTPSDRQGHTRLSKLFILSDFPSDAISSAVYVIQHPFQRIFLDRRQATAG